jgi:hypothetical protein
MSNNHFVVALGGTGGKVVRELRKSLHRASSERNTDVHFEFLYVDTSSDEIDKKDAWRVLGEDASLGNAQVLINKAGGVGAVLDDPGRYPGLAPWIEPRNVFSFVNAGTAGAAQKRKLGRLVFAQHVVAFKNAAVQRVSELEQASRKRGATIHVVCGLAGGTGSGSVVDAVAQLRFLFPNERDYRILVYAVLPEDNPGEKAKDTGRGSTYFANAYAALAELNAMAVGQVHPINVLDGQRMSLAPYFNGCYLVANVNERGTNFNVDTEVPQLIAEFIYQKSQNGEWEGLGRAERGENDTYLAEMEGDRKVRSRLFLSFGIERVIVPEDQIREFMAYGFAEQAIRQLTYNNWRDTEGFADEVAHRDWRSHVRQAELLQSLSLSDAHLTLEQGVLEDDVRAGWKPVREFWSQVVAGLVPQIRADKGLDQATWTNVLEGRLAAVFGDTYRKAGGVAKFYETKTKSRVDIARQIARTVERHLFAEWKSGQSSLLQQRDFLDALDDYLDERLAQFNDLMVKGKAELDKAKQTQDELSSRFNNVGFLGKHLTDKRESLFAEIAKVYEARYAISTLIEGRRFATQLIPVLRDELTRLRGSIDRLQQRMAEASKKLSELRATQLRSNADSDVEQQIYDRSAIDSVLRRMLLDEAGQKARVQELRRALIAKGGAEADSYERLEPKVLVQDLVNLLSEQSSAIVTRTHAELAQSMQPVLNVNIVERLARQYDGNHDGLKAFAAQLHAHASNLLRFNASEVSSDVGRGAGSRTQTLGVLLPNCEPQQAFRERLESFIKTEASSGAALTVMPGRRANQIVLLTIGSLMPVRFYDGLRKLRTQYDAVRADAGEAVLLHGEGDGQALPSLFARKASEIEDDLLSRPLLLTARLMGLIKQRTNKSTGLQEWVLVEEEDGLPKSTLLGSDWLPIWSGAPDPGLMKRVRDLVFSTLQSTYQHIDKKKELDAAYTAFMRERYVAAGEDDTDSQYVELGKDRARFRASILKLPS